MKKTSPPANERIARILLVVCSVCVSGSILLTTWFVVQQKRVASLTASLLSQNELQEKLLRDQPLDQTLTPHIVREIGFVLNRDAKRSTLFAHEGDSYPVNSLGLRGAEIGPKEVGVKRVLIVGDSIVFGWKLKDEDRLSAVLNKYIAERGNYRDQVEFLTIALPGWNVWSQTSFLESHLLLLDPDLILWWSIANDIEDVNGVVPPGIWAHWASPQAQHVSPFAGLSILHKRSGSFMPAIAERREKNVALIASFAQKFGIPIVIMGLPALDEHRLEYGTFDPPVVHFPREYLTDPKTPLSESDGHPSAWANRVIAMGVLRKLGQLGAITPVDFAESDKVFVEWFTREDDRVAAESRVANLRVPNFEGVLGQIPTVYRNEAWRGHESVLHGVGRLGKMAKAGTIFLRDPGRATNVVLSISLPNNIERYPGRAHFTVRTRTGETTHLTADLNSKRTDLVLALPKAPEGIRVYEISWTCDFVLCDGPSSCFVGTLLRAGFD